MEITSLEKDGVTRILISGSLDFQSTPDLESRFASLAETIKSSAILDLSGIDYLSSIGVRALVTTGKAIASKGGRLVLLNPQDVVRTVLFTTGVNHVMPIVFDDDDALRAATA